MRSPYLTSILAYIGYFKVTFNYLKLKNYLQYIALIHYKLSLVFKIYPTCSGASLAPSSGVSLNQISCLVGLLLCMLCSCTTYITEEMESLAIGN
jgi:hypothetical protein